MASLLIKSGVCCFFFIAYYSTIKKDEQKVQKVYILCIIMTECPQTRKSAAVFRFQFSGDVWVLGSGRPSCSGEFPAKRWRELASAPCSTRIWTTSLWPAMAAAWRGCSPAGVKMTSSNSLKQT